MYLMLPEKEQSQKSNHFIKKSNVFKNALRREVKLHTEMKMKNFAGPRLLLKEQSGKIILWVNTLSF